MSASIGSPARCSSSSVTVHVSCSRAEASAPAATRSCRRGARPPGTRRIGSHRPTVLLSSGADHRPIGADAPVRTSPYPGMVAGTRADLPEHVRVRPGTRAAVAADRVGGPVRGLVALAHRFPDRGRRPVDRVGALTARSARRFPTGCGSASSSRSASARRPSMPRSTGTWSGTRTCDSVRRTVGTRVEAAWTVEMRQPAMRLASRARSSGAAMGARPGGRDDGGRVPYGGSTAL